MKDLTQGIFLIRHADTVAGGGIRYSRIVASRGHRLCAGSWAMSRYVREYGTFHEPERQMLPSKNGVPASDQAMVGAPFARGLDFARAGVDWKQVGAAISGE
jgi:hypothetical protein